MIALVHAYAHSGLAGVWVPGTAGPWCVYRRGQSRMRARGEYLVRRDRDLPWLAMCRVLCARQWHNDAWVAVRADDTTEPRVVLNRLTATDRSEWPVEQL